MKTYLQNRFLALTLLASALWLPLAALAGPPTVSFTSPTNSQVLISLMGFAGTAATTNGVLSSVTFTLLDASAGQWWSGSNYQASAVPFPTQLTGTNWIAAPGFVPPLICCGRTYQLAASATDTSNYVGTTTITVTADSTAPVVVFASPTNGQPIVNLSNLAGTVVAITTVQQVTISIYNQNTGQYWDGTNFQGSPVSLPVILAGTNWSSAAGFVPPAVCCGQSYQIRATATDILSNVGTTTINVTADSSPPVAIFSPLINSQTITNLSDVGGSVTDNFGLVASVAFSLHEQDINYGAGRWWNGTNFQSTQITLPAIVSGTNWSPAPGVVLPQLNSGQSYDLTVIATDTSSNSASTTITVTDAITVLAWDPGVAPEGTALLANPNTNGGNYWFKITTQNPAVGVWRTALKVTAGEAGVFLSYNSPSNTNSASYRSTLIGSDGFVLHASQFSPSQDWYVLVNSTTNAQWTLMTGDIFVYDLGALAADAASGTNVTMPPESMAFFKTTIAADTLAWRLWLNGAGNQMFVKKSAAPHPASFELIQSGQMLVVPPYLAGGTFNGTYFIGITGNPGTAINLDSRKHAITDLAFSSLTYVTVAATNFPYVTYRVQVPVQQIAWQLNLTPTTGNPSVSVRRDLVPNEFRNDAFSETPQNVGASVTLVPPPPQSGAGVPGLSDGTFYVTVYSTGAYTCGFNNANPTITDVHYFFSITNDAPSRAGWRFYRVGNIAEQLGTLGWALTLSNQVPGSEIALRRNAVPGQWIRRDKDNNNQNDYYSQAEGYVDKSSSYGLLQDPGHQSDIWYVGVYTPTNALGSFVLRGFELTGQLTPFDGAGSSVSVNNQLPGQWGFFRIDVPSDCLGWDVRLVGVTNGNPRLVVSRDTLPTSFSGTWPWSGSPWFYYPNAATNWPSGSQWYNADWADGGGCSSYQVPMLAMGLGNPLAAGTYYIGVQDPDNASSYTLQSRGIGLTNYAIRVQDLSVNGSTNNPSLAVTEGDYYRVVVPSNAPNWKLHLNATLGEVLLKVQQDYLPNSGYGQWPEYYWPYGYGDAGLGGQLMMKPGDEQWALLPENGYNVLGQNRADGTNLMAGTYYVLVASQGQNATNNCHGAGSGWGAGHASYTLTSQVEPVTQLPNTLSYGSDLIFTNAQAGGELKFYQFNVPAGIASIEVRLENRVGNPTMYLNTGMVPVGTANYSYDGYGNYGGTNYQWNNGNLITVVNPTITYSLSVYASTTNYSGYEADASYVVRVHALPPPLVAFDGGTFAVTNQAAGNWQFFRIDVPSDCLGWDVRLVGVTNGNPRLVVSRDTLPTSFSGTWPWSGSPWFYYPNAATNWPSGSQWYNADWADGGGCSSYQVPMLAMGLGNPLAAGTYYIGVQDPDNASSYTLQSRGIGLTNYAIRVQDLSVNGSTNNPSLAVTEGDYYRVVVPSNAPNWKLHLNATLGEVLLKVQQDYLPNSGYGQWPEYYWPYGYGDAGLGGQLMMKPGDEQWALLPENGYNVLGQNRADGTNLMAGTYYVLVASQGQNATNNCHGAGSGWGAGHASYTLTSQVEPVTQLPNTLSYGSDLIFTNAQAGGELKFYQFNVPAGIASIEVRLENRVGNPTMYLNTGMVPVGTANYSYDGYGNYGGTNYQWNNGNLITVVNPTITYSLSVYASTTNYSGYEADASYVVRVHALPPPLVAFDGGTFAVTNQAAGNWQFFRIDVPSDCLGWDVRLVGVTNGNPRLVVSRDTLPTSFSGTWPWSGSPWFYYPNAATNWPSGSQWYNADWADGGGCSSYQVPMLAMGLGNPLAAGTYYIGVQDPDNASSYTLQSRGIGLTNYAIRVQDLSVNGSTNNPSLAVTEGDYYRVVVPSNAPNWKLHLNATLGEVLLKVQQDYLPNSGYGQWPEYYWPYGYGDAGLGGQLMMKPGDEQWALLPENGYNVLGQNRADGTNLMAGTYYVLVASQGQNATNNCHGAGSGWGAGHASYTLTSQVEPVTQLPNTLSYGSDLIFTNAQAGGELKFYQFNVPAGIASIEVRLENRVGNPTMYLNTGMVPVGTANYSYDGYGNYGGTNYQWNNGNLISIPNPQPGWYSLSVAGSSVSGSYPDASFLLRVRAPVIPQLSFSFELNGVSLSNCASGLLADNQRAFYQVTVPASVAGAPVLGWKLDLTSLNGTPSVRVRQNLLPDDNGNGGTSPFNTVTATIVPPYLSPGTWYVEVKGSGSTTYSLTSSVITTNTLTHPLWVMPTLGQTNIAPGLSLPMLGDSGIDASGNPLPGDQGIDLEQGQFDYYAVVVPTNNAAVLRTVLQAISGDPNLYLRVGASPTLAHYSNGYYDVDNYHRTPLYDRSLTGSATEYASWVPLNGRYETQLTNGLWVLAVQAGGNANVRYRLQLSCGNSVTNGLVQELALAGGSFTNQNLSGGDWRYYRVQIPSNAPVNWAVTFSRSLGSARMFVRDSSPPGDGNYISPGNYANQSYNPGPWYNSQNQDLETWAGDGKNQGPYPRFDSPGTYNLPTPPLRLGSVYYLGFWSPVDTTFSVSSSTNGGTIDITNILAFNGGSISGNLPSHGTLRYRMDVPISATRILFNASNSANVVLALEQGTLALAGGPAHWTSYLYNDKQYGNQANASLNQPLFTANNWPWLPGHAYYLTITNTASEPESIGLAMSLPADLVPVSFVAPTNVISTHPNPSVQVVWGVTNLGPATASNNWYDTVWFSTNGVLDANSVNVGNFWLYNQNVPAGGSYWQTNNVTLPLVASGNYTLFVQVDAGNSIYEANLNNKFSTGVSGVFMLTPPDLMPVSVVQNVGGLTNLQTHFGPLPESLHSYTNNTDQSWTNYYAGAQALQISFDPQCAGEACCDRLHILDGSGGEIAGSPFRLEDLAGQTKLVMGNTAVLRLTSDGSVTGWGFAVTQIQSGQLASGAPVVSSTANPTIQVAWGVTNQGIGSVTGGWFDRVWFSTNGILDTHSMSLGDFYFNQTVPAGGAYGKTTPVTLPVTIGGAYDYMIFVQVDINNNIYESNENDNISSPVSGTLILNLAPQITIQPLNQFAVLGTNVTFSAAAVGSPILYYQWQRNTTNLPDATNTTLVLTNVQASSTGNYRLLVTNAFGMAVSTAAGLLVVNPGTNCTIAPAGLIAWWPGEGNASDVVGSNNGTLQSGATFASGKVGQAFSFDGIDDHVSIGTTGSLAGSFTIEFWTKPMSSSTTGPIGSRGPQDASYDMQLSGSGIHGDIGNGSSWITTSADAAYSFTVGNWYHIASIVTPTNYTLMINGVVVGSGSFAFGNPILFDPNHQLRIGSLGSSYGYYFNGLMDEVSIYNRALSFIEIAAIYQAGAQGKCPIVTVTPSFDTSPSALQWSSNGLSLRLGGLTGHGPVIIYASTNLTSWTPIYTNPSAIGTIQFLDSSATNFPLRFYRAIEQ